MILSPIEFKNLSLKNRLAWLPMVSWLGDEDGFVTPALIERYRRRAQGGVGLIILEAAGVSDGESPKLLRINDDKYIPGLEKMVQAVHDAGAKTSIQLIHFVKQSGSGWKQKIEDLTYDEIKQVKKDFVQGAIRAKKAGFDAIELQVAHNCTLSSFVSFQNQREDEYGRDNGGRAKIVKDIIEMCRENLGDDYCIGARISGEEFVIGGNTMKQTKPIAKIMVKAGLDYLSVSAGGKNEDRYWNSGYSGSRAIPAINLPNGCHVYLAKGLREELSPLGVPVIASGKINSLEMGEQILAEEKADLIGVARPLLADPDWILKQKGNRKRAIVPCGYCNICLEKVERREPVECVVAELLAAKACEFSQ